MRLQSFFALLTVALPLVQSAPVSHDEIVANTATGFRLLELEEGADPVWVTEEEKDALVIEDKGFVRHYPMPFPRNSPFDIRLCSIV